MWGIIRSLIRRKEKSSHIRDDIPHRYIGVSTSQIKHILQPSKLQKMIQKNINNVIKRLPENIDKLNSIRRDVQATKNVIGEDSNLLSGIGHIDEKISIIYSEFDRLLDALDDEIKKTKQQ
jgi:uncharacterized small protein (DUF1192 family)